jgi:putative Holliday junction resolvase
VKSGNGKPPSTLLAIDYGLKRIGIATGSLVTGTASPLETVASVANQPNWERLRKLISEWQPDIIVVGLPRNQDGTDSEMTTIVNEFATELLGRCGIPVEFIDERYTSVEAEALLREQRRQGIRNKKLRKEDVDAVAAQLIAESWMRKTAGNH